MAQKVENFPNFVLNCLLVMIDVNVLYFIDYFVITVIKVVATLTQILTYYILIGS